MTTVFSGRTRLNVGLSTFVAGCLLTFWPTAVQAWGGGQQGETVLGLPIDQVVKLYIMSAKMHQDKIKCDKQAIQKLRDINPLNTTPDEALELQKQIRELEKDIASEERQRERAIDDLIRAAMVEGSARAIFGGPIPTPEQAGELLRSGAFSQYTALASTTDPVAQRLTGRSQLSEGLQPLRMKPAPIDEGIGVSFFGGTDISHSSSSGLRGYSAWGLPTATSGWSSTSTLSGGGVRLDLSRPLGLPQDQRLAVAAGVWSSASSVQAGPSIADFGFSSGAYPNSVILGLSVGPKTS